MVQVCQRSKTKHQMLEESVEQYRQVFAKATAEFEKVVNVRLAFALDYWKLNLESA
jgi:hypothetical protein